MKANLWAMVTASVFVGAACIVGAGCGKSDAQMAGDTARTFMGALANDDKTLARTQMTRLAREKMDETASSSDKGGMGKDGYTVGEATVDGDSASVPVTVTERNDNGDDSGENGENAKTAPSVIEVAPTSDAGNADSDGEKSAQTRTETIVLKLRREDGEWKVWAMRVPLAPGGPNITMDFEHPEAVIGEAFKGLGEGLGAAMKGLGEGVGAMFQGMAKGMTEGAKAAGEGAKAAGDAAEAAEKAAASAEHTHNK